MHIFKLWLAHLTHARTHCALCNVDSGEWVTPEEYVRRWYAE